MSATLSGNNIFLQIRTNLYFVTFYLNNLKLNQLLKLVINVNTYYILNTYLSIFLIDVSKF